MQTFLFFRRLFSAAFSGAAMLNACWLAGGQALPAQAADPSFMREVGPILKKHCVSCHGAMKVEAGYRMDTYRRLMSEGDSGEIVVTGSAEKSELVRRLLTEDTEERMPAESPALSAEAIRMIQRWIDAGAKFDGDDPDAPLGEGDPTSREAAAAQR